MKNLLRTALISLALAAPASGQFIGYGLPQTTQQTILNAVTVATISANVRNLGQTVHRVAYVIGGTGAPSQVVLRILASNDGTNYFAISEDATLTGGAGSVFASGYYLFVKVQLVTFTVASGTPTLTAVYTGTAVSPSEPWGDDAAMVFLKQFVVSRAASSGFSTSLHIPPSRTMGGFLYVTFSAATCAGSSFTIQVSPQSVGSVTIVPTTSLATSASTQVFFIPSFGGFSGSFNYTSGCGVSAATITVELAVSTAMQVMAGSNGAQPPVITPIAVSTSGAITTTPGGNANSTLITCAGCTTTQTTADQTNVGQRGLKVVVNMTVVGTGSITCAIQGKDSASSAYYAQLTSLAITTNSTYVLTLYPGISAGANVSASDILPLTWRVVCTANNANATTYTVGASVIN